MGYTQTIATKNAKETQKVGESLATHILTDLSAPRICCLYGDLGVGKTVFAQGCAKGLGLPSRLVSPTFIIVRRYELNMSARYFYHIDLYRLQKIEEIQGLGLNEIFYDNNAIAVIEWAERLGNQLPGKRIDIRLTLTDENKRTINIQYVL